jgi:hypothetical protein
VDRDHEYYKYLVMYKMLPHKNNNYPVLHVSGAQFRIHWSRMIPRIIPDYSRQQKKQVLSYEITLCVISGSGKSEDDPHQELSQPIAFSTAIGRKPLYITYFFSSYI